MDERDFHPAANIFPLMSADEFQRLKSDIEERGQQEDAIVLDGKIIDGRNRYLACRELGLDINCCELEGCEDPIGFVISANLHRRQLKTSQRAMCAAKLAGLPVGRPKENVQICKNTLADAGLLFTVSIRSISSALEVLHDGCDALIRLCELGELPVSTACKFMELTTKPIEKKVAKQGAKAVREYIKAQQHITDDDGPVSDETYFVKFKAVWDAADETGRAAIRAFIANDD
jgi:hypothetical protein